MLSRSAQVVRCENIGCRNAGMERRGAWRTVVSICGGAESEYGTYAGGDCFYGSFALSSFHARRVMRDTNDVIYARSRVFEERTLEGRQREGRTARAEGGHGMEGSKYTHRHRRITAACSSRNNG